MTNVPITVVQHFLACEKCEGWAIEFKRPPEKGEVIDADLIVGDAKNGEYMLCNSCGEPLTYSNLKEEYLYEKQWLKK